MFGRKNLNTSQVLKKQKDIQIKLDKLGSLINIPAQFGDRFCKRDVDLLHLAVYEAINFHKSIANAYRGEEYTQDFI